MWQLLAEDDYIQEIEIVKGLDHSNVIQLITVTSSHYCSRLKWSLLFELSNHDLAGILHYRDVPLELEETRQMLKQVLRGIAYIHGKKILHRDVKPANILVSKDGVVKIADFGLARTFDVGQTTLFTTPVVTLWYRPPEILLGDTNYGPGVDMWGVGCIMGEMSIREPMMKGDSEQQQLNYISDYCGSITPTVWPGVNHLPLFTNVQLNMNRDRSVQRRMKHYMRNAHAVDLLDKLLMLDPRKRPTANTALEHEYFKEDGKPCDLRKLFKQFPRNMFESPTSPDMCEQIIKGKDDIPRRQNSGVRGYAIPTVGNDYTGYHDRIY